MTDILPTPDQWDHYDFDGWVIRKSLLRSGKWVLRNPDGRVVGYFLTPQLAFEEWKCFYRNTQ